MSDMVNSMEAINLEEEEIESVEARYFVAMVVVVVAIVLVVTMLLVVVEVVMMIVNQDMNVHMYLLIKYQSNRTCMIKSERLKSQFKNTFINTKKCFLSYKRNVKPTTQS